MAYDMMDKVESGWITELLKNDYITNNSIPVKKYRQNQFDAVHNSIAVFARVPRTERDRNQDTWDIPTEILCFTNPKDDKDLVLIRKLIEAVFDVAINTEYTDFSTSGNINFLGVSFDGYPDEEYDSQKQLTIINLLTKVTDVNQ